ncbi:hypothetical protein [Novosphingobium olei]|uniref:Uncharacterized protein n=1 Tax=Novosphingobium olei TaxID=2728851 RepID=A0A7Y0BST6_9SPHN|nr:hypothetical protein [Novosphingobium olei]NML95891.1 hypothetical protein [Novosphingobium olei]
MIYYVDVSGETWQEVAAFLMDVAECRAHHSHYVLLKVRTGVKEEVSRLIAQLAAEDCFEIVTDDQSAAEEVTWLKLADVRSQMSTS